jgi:predicted peptidase
MIARTLTAVLSVALSLTASAADTRPRLAPGTSFAVEFPELPPTFFAISQKKDAKAQMTVFLPKDYDASRKFPLLVFLNGGDGGAGGNPGVARAITEEQGCICVNMPLFKAVDPKASGGNYIVRADDGKYMWPFFRQMLTKLDERVPNIDPDRRVLGGFSNGAHATAALIDESEGEISRLVRAFLFVEGGGKLQHYDLLKDKPFLMVSSNAKSQPRAQQICDAAKAAGAKATLVAQDVGGHAFPPAAYPAVRQWLRDAVAVEPPK